MQFARRKKSLSRAEKTALGAFRKRSVRVVWNEDLLREKGGSINVKLQLTYMQGIQHCTNTAWSAGQWEVCYTLKYDPVSAPVTAPFIVVTSPPPPPS